MAVILRLDLVRANQRNRKIGMGEHGKDEIDAQIFMFGLNIVDSGMPAGHGLEFYV
jgi:hypothetical protein